MLLLVRRSDADLDALAQQLATEAEQLHRAAPAGASVRCVVRLRRLPFADADRGSDADDAGGQAFDGLVEVAADGAASRDLVASVEGIASRLADVVDAERSAAVLGNEHVIVAGDRPLMLAFGLRRLPALTGEAFRDHWLNKHAEIGRNVPGSQGYRQLHADPDASRAAADAAGVAIADYDGVALAYYEDEQTFVEILSNPAVAEVALEDERRFIDHTRSGMLVGFAPAAAATA